MVIYYYTRIEVRFVLNCTRKTLILHSKCFGYIFIGHVYFLQITERIWYYDSDFMVLMGHDIRLRQKLWCFMEAFTIDVIQKIFRNLPSPPSSPVTFHQPPPTLLDDVIYFNQFPLLHFPKIFLEKIWFFHTIKL